MLTDTLQRPAKDLRISVTDKCNFRCDYCMPHDHYQWLERQEILTFEETARLARIFISLGVESIRLTGGEPLLRRDLERLVAQLSALPGLHDLSLTTNGSLLLDKLTALAGAGLQRINVSVDSLKPERFHRLTRRPDLHRVLEGIHEAVRLGLKPVKVNAVILRGINDDEILDLVEFSRAWGAPVRFIEYMDAGNSSLWQSERLVPKQEILDRIRSRYALREIGRADGTAPSVDYECADGRGDVGVIASVSEPFCQSCTRVRLTADGKMVTCLFSDRGHDLRTPLRSGLSDWDIAELIRGIWQSRSDRFSEERLAALRSGDGYSTGARKKFEMIRLGG